MKKVLPIVIVMLLIIGVGGGVAWSLLAGRYKPTEEVLDYASEMGLAENEYAVTLNHEVLKEDKAAAIDGRVYLSMALVTESINTRFYWDDNEKLFLFTTPTEVMKVTPDQQSVCAVDSGLDQVKIYRIDRERNKMELEDILRCELDSGPKMLRFDRQHKFAYVLCEMDNVIEVYEVGARNDDVDPFKMIQRISTIEPDEKQRAAASGIEFSPDGNHLFVTNAGINTVIIYDVDKETGVLTPLFHCKTSGDYPKAVAVMPDNKHFIVLSHETDEIFIYNMNYEDCYFLQDSRPIKIEQPNCIFIHKL